MFTCSWLVHTISLVLIKGQRNTDVDIAGLEWKLNNVPERLEKQDHSLHSGIQWTETEGTEEEEYGKDQSVNKRIINAGRGQGKRLFTSYSI